MPKLGARNVLSFKTFDFKSQPTMLYLHLKTIIVDIENLECISIFQIMNMSGEFIFSKWHGVLDQCRTVLHSYVDQKTRV